MRIAMFYYAETEINAHGKLDRQIMRALCSEHDITVFAMAFDNPDPDRIRFVRVPRAQVPLFLLLIVFHILAPLTYLLHRLRHHARFDVIHFHEVDLPFGNVAYVHFCNSAYLARPDADSPWSGIRPLARWLEHRLRALIEPVVFRRVPRIVVPSQGLAEELARTFGPRVAVKTTVISNFIPVEHFARPPHFDPGEVRVELGWGRDDLVAVFAALGHYERKGLPLLVEALHRLENSTVKLLIVGGTTAGARRYLDQAEAWGLGSRVRLIETQPDIRRYLWAADVFVLPSRYETFSLVAYEAAAAGLPLLVTPVYGVVDLVEDTVNGWLLSLDPADIAERLRFCVEHREVLSAMGARAAKKAATFDQIAFSQRWSAYYRTVEDELISRENR